MNNTTVVCPDDDNSASDRNQLITAIAALVVSFAALFVSLVQLLQQYSLSAKGYSTCSAKVMGPWAAFTRRKIVWSQFRVEVQLSVPVLFVSPLDNVKGPLGEHKDKPIVFMNGSDDTYRKSHTWLLEEYDQRTRQRGRDTTENIRTADNEMATWLALMMAVQRMERESRIWAATRMCDYEPPVSRALPEHSLAVGMQVKKRSWDTMPEGVARPFATTTIAHFVEIMAMLGVYWKEFDRNENKFRAQGNGFIVTGRSVANLGVAFTFQKAGKTWFQENRLIPNNSVKELCFGFCPTIFRPTAKFVLYADEPKDVSTLQLATKSEISETLVSFGCNTRTINYFRHNADIRYAHLFPIPFEMLGMVGTVLQIPQTAFTMLPNPTFFVWDKSFFSLRKLLFAFEEAVNDALGRQIGFKLTPQISKLVEYMHLVRDSEKADLDALHILQKNAETSPRIALSSDEPSPSARKRANTRTATIVSATKGAFSRASTFMRTPTGPASSAAPTTAADPRGSRPPSPSSLGGSRSTLQERLSSLHAAISHCDAFLLDPKIFPYVKHVFCLHIQEVLKYLNPTSKEQDDESHSALSSPAGAMATAMGVKTTTSAASPPVSSQMPLVPNGYVSLQQLDSASLGARHDLLARLYVLHVREKVVAAPIPTAVNIDAPQQRSSGNSLDDLDINSFRSSNVNVHSRQPSGSSGTPHQASRHDIDDIWCTLVFRMMCWLMLHDFHKKDLQLSKSDLFDSRLPVYIL